MAWKVLTAQQTQQAYSKIFNDFANKEISVVKGAYNRLEVAPGDAVAAALTKEVADLTGGYTALFIEGNIYPGSMPGGTTAVFAKKDADNKYRIKQVGIGSFANK